jgi:hypothetical protein
VITVTDIFAMRRAAPGHIARPAMFGAGKNRRSCRMIEITLLIIIAAAFIYAGAALKGEKFK